MKPTITRGPASHYAARDETIREISNGDIGCLISVRTVDEQLIIDVYRRDHGVIIRLDKETTP